MLTWVEIKAAALRHNIGVFTNVVGNDKLLMVAIKGNAYGHGFLEMARILNTLKTVNRFCVVDLGEAIRLIDDNIKTKIIILSFFDLNDCDNIKRAISNGVAFPVYTREQARLLDKIGNQIKKKAVIHVKVDSGASRIGVLASEAVKFVQSLDKFKFLNIEGIFSHYASSEDDKLFTDNQLLKFKQVIEELKKQNIDIPIRHLSCSTAAVLYPQTRFNAVRIGLGAYGLYPDELTRKKIKLKPVLSWHTIVMQVKIVPAWSKISYGGTYTAKRAIKLAILPVGYYDGYDRSLSNRAEVIINGVKCPIRGRICMNMCMADVTGLKKVKAGDRATLIGKVGRQSITADELAKIAETINYEIVNRINPLIPRIVK
ncbi:MAG: alanine racemase [Candidatus Magasanikbacteria bacterium]|jgi:alanine racemase